MVPVMPKDDRLDGKRKAGARPLWRRIGRLLLIACVVLALPVLVLLAPVAGTALLCHGETGPVRQSLWTDTPREAGRTFLAYPEWHIVYAYEDYATALETGAPRDMGWMHQIAGFWSSLCVLMAEADAVGGATSMTATVYTIGVSFTAEMVLKGAFEETLGAVVYQPGPVADLERAMARDYAGFLLQTPWYRYPFQDWLTRLEALSLDGWKDRLRRAALRLEWAGKAAWAGVITDLAATMPPDALRMDVALTEMEGIALPDGWTLVETAGEVRVFEVDRYRAFTTALQQVLAHGAVPQGIAGNDLILISALGAALPELPPEVSEIFTYDRSGVTRFLLKLPVALLGELVARGVVIEHVYDY